MAWENALDRLLLKQVHLAEKGELRAADVQAQILDTWNMNSGRPQTAFHLGYARALLGADLPQPRAQDAASRWYTFGRLRGHDRCGERTWVADLIKDQTALMELLQEPEIARACMPLVMRSLFWCGDLDTAVSCIEYLALSAKPSDTDLFVDAALTDLLSRLEALVRDNGGELCGDILQRVIKLGMFESLPGDVRSRYYRAYGRYLLKLGEFDPAAAQLERAAHLSHNQARLHSSVAALRGLASMRLHDFAEMRVNRERADRASGLSWFDKAVADKENAIPEAWVGRGILLYENGKSAEAAECFNNAVQSSRRTSGRDDQLVDRARFYLGAVLLEGGKKEEAKRAVRLIEQSLATMSPDLEVFYSVHEALKKLDRKVALKFLDSIEVARGTAPDQLLLMALEYQSLGESEPAAKTAERVLEVAVNLDQRIEAMRVMLTCHNMRGDREAARGTFYEIRDLLLQRGAFNELETLLKNEEFVGQALDHLEIKCELVSLYDEMAERETEKVTLQCAIARSLKARKDVEALQQAFGILKEVEIGFPEMARDELTSLEKLLALNHAEPANLDDGQGLVRQATERLGRQPQILVVGGNERQRRHHPRFEQLAREWGFAGEWWMANYTSPQKLVNQISERLKGDLDLLVLLHWNRHETTEPALDMARKADVMARTVHYAGFTSLQVALTEALGRIGQQDAEKSQKTSRPGNKPAKTQKTRAAKTGKTAKSKS
jgi:tetratricopeptide (TPR) repeat protein